MNRLPDDLVHRVIILFAVCNDAPGPDRAIVFQGKRIPASGGNRDDLRQTGQATGRRRPARLLVAAPHPDGAIVLQGNGMMRAGRNGFDRRQTRNLERDEASLALSVAELAVVVVAPRPDRAILPQGKGMPHSRRDSRDVGKSGHLAGRGTVVFGPVAKLAAPIVSPSPDGAVALQGNAMTIAGDDRFDVGKTADLPGGRKVAVRSCAGAELTPSIVAPSPDRAVSLQGDRMAAPRRDCDNIRQDGHCGRHRVRVLLLGGGGASTPARIVISPCPQGGIALDEVGAGGSYGDRRQRRGKAE